MAITLLFGCCQIETTVRDLDEVRDFMHDAFGAGPIEQVLAQQIDAVAPGTSYGCDHLGLGEAVFQVNQPDPAMIFNGHPSIHQTYLDRVGPSVTNLNFFIDDYVHAKELLTSMGAPTHIEGSSATAPALADYGPDNTRPGGQERPFLFLGSRHLIGLDLEIMEPNFLRFSDQEVQYPAYVQPRPQTDDGNLLLERLRIVVPDLETVLQKLKRMFTPGCLSKPYAYRKGRFGCAFRVWLGGIEIEYCQPLAGNCRLQEALDRFGPGVVTVDFTATDLPAAIDRCKAATNVTDEPDWLGLAGMARGYHVASREPAGFDAVLSARGETPFAFAD